MEKFESQWKAPESSTYGEVMKVTGRSWDALYENFNVQDEDFIGKTVISLGNGLSDLPEHINELNDNTHCYAIDPIYSFLGGTYKEFFENTKKHNLEAHLNLATPEKYKKFKREMGEGSYIAGIGEALPFKDVSIDTILISELIGNIDDQNTVFRIIGEAIRVLKSEGELRISELRLPVFDDGSVELDRDDDPRMNLKSAEKWFEILQYLQRKKCHVFSAFCEYEGKPLGGGYGIGGIPMYKGLIIRKDKASPRITYNYRTEFDKKNVEAHLQENGNRILIEIDPAHSKPPSKKSSLLKVVPKKTIPRISKI